MDDLKIEIATKDQHDELVEFLLDHFCQDEPVSRSIQMSRENCRKMMNFLVAEGLTDPVSFVCLNPERKIVACRLNMIVDMTNKSSEPEPSPPEVATFNSTELKIEQFLEALTEGLSQLLPECKKYMKFIAVSVHPQYQRRGIATKLINLSLEKAREMHCDHIVCTATAYNSQQMFEKLKFKTLKTIEHQDWLDEHGQQVFVCDDKTTCGKLVALKL